VEETLPAMSTFRDRALDAESEVLPDLADLVVSMSRLLVELSAIAPLKKAGFSLNDWIALSVLARGLAHNNRELAKVLGVTRQRANQIKKSLEEMRLISSRQSSEDARENVLVVTGVGYARLEEVSVQVLALMSSSLKDRERLLAKTNRAVRMLRGAIRATRLGKTAGRSE
jgi:DNA-binding MarR family transcriptional regulator